MKLGVSYYPELIAPEEWTRDLEAMREASLTLLRIIEFAWSALEPREGEYRFAWLDQFLDLAHAHGFEVILCTPTATPPPWLLTQFPEILLTPRDGRARTPGGRRDCDTDSFIYREFCGTIARRLGERYGAHPAVIGWQIDNELIGPEMAPPEVHTRDGQFRFRHFLKSKYGSVEALNAAWGTRFWSGEFSDWGEITTPQNPRSTMAHVLDYGRYFTASQVEFIAFQRDALRAVIDPRQWITTNSTGVFSRTLDHVEYAHAVDICGWDAYFGAAGNPYPEAFAALAHDLFRAAKRVPFWIFETNAVALPEQTNAAFWGEMIARGAAAIIPWHWREHRAGAENRSGAICDYDGRPDPARIEFLRGFAARPELTETLPSTFPPAPAAIVWSPDEVRAQNSPDPYLRWPVNYLDALIAAYEPARRLGIFTDAIRLGDDLTPYKLLLMPSHRIFEKKNAARLIEWVRTGGVLVATAKTAHLDEHGVFFRTPGEPLRELLGFEVRRDSRGNEEPSIAWGDDRFRSLAHFEHVESVADDVEVLAHFESKPFAAEPAVLARRFGAGHLFYAAATSRELNEKLLRLASEKAGLEIIAPPEGVIVLPHLTKPNRRWIFNYSTKPRQWSGATVPPRDFIIAAHPQQSPTPCKTL